MELVKELKNRMVLVVIYFISLVEAVKVHLGILKVKYGIIGYFQLRGLNLSTCVHSEKTTEACMEYGDFRSDDVILVTYPKTGTHFMADIIASIFTAKGLVPPNGMTAHTSAFEIEPRSFTGEKKKGDLSLVGLRENLAKIPSPRIIMTHLPLDLLHPKAREGKVKVIHCFRNPKDTACSFYPFLKKLRILSSDTTWKNFFHNHIAGNGPYLSHMEYMRRWFPYRNMKNLLNIQFEDLKEDLESNVRKISAFLGIDLTDEEVRRITVSNQFENKVKEVGKGHFVYRSGKSGGWKSELTVEESEIMDEWIAKESQEMEGFQFKYGR